MIQDCNLHWRYHEGEVVMPWFTLPALVWLKSRDVSGWSVFEYGVGYSTIWWKLNANSVRGVDHDQKWAKMFDAVHCVDQQAYVNACSNPVDCIVVDGEHRYECIKHIVQHNHVNDNLINVGGFLIIDNFEFFSDLIKYDIMMMLNGWEHVGHFKQPNHSAWTTAVFRRLV